MTEKYRRKDDEGLRLLWELNERVENIQATLKEKFLSQQAQIKGLEFVQKDRPCKVHELRIKFLEKIMYAVGGVMCAVVAKIIYDFF